LSVRLCDRLIRKGCLLAEGKFREGKFIPRYPEGCLIELSENEVCPFEHEPEFTKMLLELVGKQ